MGQIGRQLKENWVFLTFFTVIVIWYANVNSRITQAESDIKDLKGVALQIVDVKTDIAIIKTSVEFIKQRVK